MFSDLLERTLRAARQGPQSISDFVWTLLGYQPVLGCPRVLGGDPVRDGRRPVPLRIPQPLNPTRLAGVWERGKEGKAAGPSLCGPSSASSSASSLMSVGSSVRSMTDSFAAKPHRSTTSVCAWMPSRPISARRVWPASGSSSSNDAVAGDPLVNSASRSRISEALCLEPGLEIRGRSEDCREHLRELGVHPCCCSSARPRAEVGG